MTRLVSHPFATFPPHPQGYTFEAEAGGQPFTVRVPAGGVAEGQKFSVPFPAGANGYSGESNGASYCSGVSPCTSPRASRPPPRLALRSGGAPRLGAGGSVEGKCRPFHRHLVMFRSVLCHLNSRSRRLRAWQDGLCDCFRHGLVHPVLWNACCCRLSKFSGLGRGGGAEAPSHSVFACVPVGTLVGGGGTRQTTMAFISAASHLLY